ncbi:hypothetical protein BJX63DRAFT_418288 [Aspergillus granulosus]|uniref:Nucleoside phosphorylase domain-containing protein n=1 Tax=Aspergillus granulosus TaxID=176169 RepID=A0ABR4HYZ4_9EURO
MEASVPLSHDDYTVGWICALPVETAAAKLMLDKIHPSLPYLPGDQNTYILGSIGDHNIVIAGLPSGAYGTTSAAIVGTQLLSSFPAIRFGFMVGIGGGVPSRETDIRLGDIVVSQPTDTFGGVVQYDLGKALSGGQFERTGMLNRPPKVLLTALTTLQAHHFTEDSQVVEFISSIQAKIAPHKARQFARPMQEDCLFHAEYDHVGSNTCTNCDRTKLVPRPTREHEEPIIHYGLIGSANQVVKDGRRRDQLAQDLGVSCVEMEAAGLINDFPCLVIRGICDYADSHKNKEWQGYAAAAAAAYAKELLHHIPANEVETEKRILDTLSDIRKLAEKKRDIAQKQLVIQENEIKQKLSDKQLECLHLFRLTSSARDITYEWYKDRVETRVDGTCEWFLNHDNFRHWLHQDSGPLLVSADPGCGKSVLAKYLIDKRLPRSAIICYFFFKSQDQNTVRQALCALLHQLFIQRPFLIGHAMEAFKKDGHGLINSITTLWAILGNTVRDSLAGPIIIVLDALDECDESECEDLIRKIKSLFPSSRSSRLKCLLTSRPYEQILGRFRSLLESFPYVHIPGEEESKSIGQEVNLVIEYRVKQLAKEKYLSGQVEAHLAEKLLGVPHRTYLWVHLVFNYLGKEQFKKTLKGVDSMMASLPTSIYGAYEQILTKSRQYDPMVRRALCMILAASRPLTVSEMNVALNVDKTSKSIHDLDLEEDEDFKTRLRNWCGLFVSVYHDQVYFIHQTAREFLLVQTPEPATSPQGTLWQHSITSHGAHGVLAEACAFYLEFLNHDSSPTDATFLDYSAQNWGIHYREANDSTSANLVPSVLSICSPDSRSWSTWFAIFRKDRDLIRAEIFTELMISSYLGHEVIVKLLLDRGANLDSTDSSGRTPLSYAAQNGHEAIVRLLVDRGANLDSTDNSGQTPLLHAAESWHEAIHTTIIRSREWA